MNFVTDSYNGDEIYQAEASPAFDGKAEPLGRATDVPLRPGLLLDASAQEIFGLTACTTKVITDARRCILANLLSLDAEEQWVFYSRDNNYYSNLGRYAPSFYRRRAVISAIEDLHSAGLIEHQKTRPSPSAWYRSRIRPTDRLSALRPALRASAILFQTPELIIIRGSASGEAIDYGDCDLTRSMRAEATAQNDFVASFKVTLDHPSARYDELGFLRTGTARINPNRRGAYRVFTNCITWGGRWYGPWWQNLPAALRAGIRLDGESTVEEDISCCHLRLLFALAGDDLGARDAYSEVGLPRNEVKLAIQVMLNAASLSSTRQVLCTELSKTHGLAAGKRSQQLIVRVCDAFPRLASCWNTGCGLRLQNIDAHICTEVQRRLRKTGIGCLSVHDSFIVQTRHANQVRSVMADELTRTCRELREWGFAATSTRSLPNLLTMWGIPPGWL